MEKLTKKTCKSVNETEFVSVEDPLNKHRTTSNEKILVSETPNIISEENFIITPGQGNMLAAILCDEFCGERVFPYLLPIGKFGYNAPQNLPVSPDSTYNQSFKTLIIYLHQMQIIYYCHICVRVVTLMLINRLCYVQD